MDDTASMRFGLVLDCSRPERLAEFWAGALDYVNVGSAGSYVALYPRKRPGPKLLLQKVTEPKTAKNRMHLDIETPDIHVEAARLIALGATLVDAAPFSEHGSTWLLMHDPEGNEFCVCDNGNPGATAGQ